MTDAFDMLACLRIYLEIALLLAVSLVIFFGVDFVAQIFSFPLPRKRLLGLGYLLLSSSILFPLGTRFIPKGALLKPSAQVWSGISLKAFEPYALIASARMKEKSENDSTLKGLILKKKLLLAFLMILTAGMLISASRFVARCLALRCFLQSQLRIRKIGSVSILASDEAQMPFSAWLPGSNFIVLPTEILGDEESLKIAILHEMQHHRQGDTRWVHGLEMLKAIYFWHPAIYLWDRLIIPFQEFACDEALIRDQRVSPQAYGRCLVQAAERAVGSRFSLAGTTSMAASASGHLLKRRIDMMRRSLHFDFHRVRRVRLAKRDSRSSSDDPYCFSQN